MSPTPRLAAVSLDAADPHALGAFYQAYLGLEVMWTSEDFVALRGAPLLITVQRVPEHRAPDWPAGEVGKQLHLELAVDHLDEAEQSALALGATKADHQPQPDRWRVLLDPAGHPFCVTTLIPEA